MQYLNGNFKFCTSTCFFFFGAVCAHEQQDFRFVFSTQNCYFNFIFQKKKNVRTTVRSGRQKMSRAREKDVSSSAGGFEANDVPLVLTRLLYNKQLALLYYTILFVRAREGRHI
jgi:hypothetical protein